MNTPDPRTPPPPKTAANNIAAAVGSTLAPPPPPPREEDPRTRAARRALELREHMGGSMDDGVDKFYIDPRIIPDGWSYEWKRHTLLGKEDPSYQVALAQKGWEAVPRTRHPFMMPDGHQGETIEREGQILMERPKEITDEVVSHDKRKAREQVRGKEEQLGMAPAGQFERDGHPQTKPTIKKTYESIPIPDK